MDPLFKPDVLKASHLKYINLQKHSCSVDMYLSLLSVCPYYTHLTIRFQYETLFYLNNTTPLKRHLNAGILDRHLSQRCQFEQNDYSNLKVVS